jgi:hypothetical protein
VTEPSEPIAAACSGRGRDRVNLGRYRWTSLAGGTPRVAGLIERVPNLG